MEKVDKDGDSPLHNLCKYSSFESIKFLLENGAIKIVNLLNKKNQAAIHIAIELKKIAIITLLLQMGSSSQLRSDNKLLIQYTQEIHENQFNIIHFLQGIPMIN